MIKINQHIIKTPKEDLYKKCCRFGTIEKLSTDTIRKRILLFHRSDERLRLVTCTVSDKNDNWILRTGEAIPDNELLLMALDDSGTYNAQIYDRLSLEGETFTYSGSTQEKLESPENILVKKFSTNRINSSSVCNFIYNWIIEDKKDIANYVKSDPDENIIFSDVKTICLKIANNWGDSRLSIRSVEIVDENDAIVPLTASDFSAYATSIYTSSYVAANTFDTTKSKTGSWYNNQWLSSGNINQSLICVLNTPINIKKLIINNSHTNGGSTSSGAKDVKVYFSTNSYSNTTYLDLVPGSILFFDGQFPRHISSNIEDALDILHYPSTFKIFNNNLEEVDLAGTSFKKGDFITTKYGILNILDVNLLKNTIQGGDWLDQKNYEEVCKLEKITDTPFCDLPKKQSLITDINYYNSEAIEIFSDVKTICLKIANNWNNTSYIGIRSVEIVDENDAIIPLTALDFSAYSTSHNSSYVAANIFDTTRAKTGSWYNNQWLSLSGKTINQSLICVLNTPVNIKKLIINNSHSNGGSTSSGAKDVKVYFSTDTFIDTSYAAVVPNALLFIDRQLPPHTTSNIVDDFFLIALQSNEKIECYDFYKNKITLSNVQSICSGAYIKTYDSLVQVESVDYIDNTLNFTPESQIRLLESVTEIYHLRDKGLECKGFTEFNTTISDTEVPILLNENLYSIQVTDEGTNFGDIFYSLSFDNLQTYKVWTGTQWRSIVSKLDIVHGNTGNDSWHFRDDSDVWSSTNIVSVFDALNEAVIFINNQMVSSTLSSLTELEFKVAGGYSYLEGFINFSISFRGNTDFSTISEDFRGLKVKDITIQSDNENVILYEPIDLNGLNITESFIIWKYIETALFDFKNDVNFYSLVTGQTQWEECSLAQSIPSITAGMETTDKKLYIKSVMPRFLEGETYDYGQHDLSITIA